MNTSSHSFSTIPFITKKFSIIVIGVTKILDNREEKLKMSAISKFLTITVLITPKSFEIKKIKIH